MKTSTLRNAALPLVGLLALLIYILACTSFSPDDKKILFPTFDVRGAIGMALYDRDARRAEPLYVPVNLEVGTNLAMPSILRGTWLPDGKSILIAAALEANKDQIEVTVMPPDGRGAVRSYRVFGVEDPGMTLMLAPCVSGNRFFFRSSERINRLDLRTGELKGREAAGATHEFYLYPSPDGQGLFYIWETNNMAVFGRVDPEQLTLSPLMNLPSRLAEGTFFAYNAAGTQVAFVEKADNDEPRCVLMEKGKIRFTRKLDLGNLGSAELAFGNAILSPRGDKVWAAFAREKNGANQRAYGLMEIPLNEAALRQKVIISAAGGEGNAYHWQVGMSHDGKFAALSSTYLACADEKFKPDDCALFIVDLADREWKVTKVPIPLPPVRVNPISK